MSSSICISCGRPVRDRHEGYNIGGPFGAQFGRVTKSLICEACARENPQFSEDEEQN